MYIAIVGDIIDSKKLINRAEIQEKLNSILNEINKKYEKSISANFIITLGDEFQGLLNNPENIIEILGKIKMELYPVKIRFGIGFGEITTEINKAMAIGADGPAFYRAREAIEEIKISEKKNEKPFQDIIMKSDDLSHNICFNLINSTLSSCSYIESKWTDKQRDVIKVIFIDSLNQSEIAKLLKLEKSSIQRRIDSSGFYTYIHGLKGVNNSLNELWRKL